MNASINKTPSFHEEGSVCVNFVVVDEVLVDKIVRAHGGCLRVAPEFTWFR